MKKRSLLMATSLVLALLVATTGTLAYLSDVDSDVNVMTLGNVQIEQIEMQRAEKVAYNDTAVEGSLVPFEQGQPLYPAYAKTNDAYTAEQTDLFYWGPYVTAESDGTNGANGAGNGLWNDNKLFGAMDKFVFVKNTGSSDAYYRTWFAFECPEGMEYSEGSDKEFMMNVNLNTRFVWEDMGYTTIDGTQYLIMCATYQNKLAPGEISRPSLLQVVMTGNADNDDMALLGDTYEILVYSQAVQTTNFPDAETALNAAFNGAPSKENHPWKNGHAGKVAVVTNNDELKAAIEDADVAYIQVTGNLTYDWGGDSYANSKALLMSGKTIAGAGNDDSITFKGYGSANPITNVTLDNITVKDETVGDNEGSWEHGHLEFVDLTANNVVFGNSIMLSGKSVLNNCEMNNEQKSWYGVWVNGGDVTIKNSTFTGTRAVKVHEAYGTEVASVVVDNCTFTLSEKPGVVIGDLNANTAVTIKNSKFATQPGDQGKYIYESDTDVNAFNFTETNNKVMVTVNNAAELAAAVAAGNTDIYLNDGEYNVDNCGGKTLTISGGKGAVITVMNEGEGGSDYGFDGSAVTFNGVTFNTEENNGAYPGFARMTATYNNCTFDGTYALNLDSEIKNCTFNVSGDKYNLWTWGATNANVTNCTFNCDGKAVLLYGGTNTNLTVNNCTFNDNGTISGKAAIEIGNDYNKSYTLTVTNATVNGFDVNTSGISTGTTLWGNKNSMSQEKLNVVVDGVDVY